MRSRNTDIGDDADHNRGNHKGNADKSDQHVADDVDDIRDGGHQSADHIGVRDYLLVFAFFFHRVIVTVEDGDNVFLALKVFG